MSSILFGNTMSLTTAATPSTGYLVAYDIDGILKQKDQFGVITSIGSTASGGVNFTTGGGLTFSGPTLSVWVDNSTIQINSLGELEIINFGTSGTSGLSGIDGISGSSGNSGTSGSSGIDGTSGNSGTSGSSGIDGTSGNSGTSGSSGIDGTSVSLSGGINYVPYYTSSTSLSSTSSIYVTGSNVGIGTILPTSKLHIKGIDSTTYSYSMKIEDGGGNPLLYVRNDGYVGIRVSNPSFPLQVNLNTNENILFRSYDAGFGSIAHFQTVNDANSSITPINFVSSTYYFTGYQANMWIGDAYLANPTARVHIKGTGTSSSTHSLKIDDAGNNPMLYVRNDGYSSFGTNSPEGRVHIKYQGSATYSTILLVDGPSANSQTGGHAAYFRRNIDNAGTTASVVTIEHTNIAGGSPGATTLRVISGANGKISQFQALSSGLFSMGATYSSGSALLTLKMDSDTTVDPGNTDRWGIRLIDNLPLVGSSANRYGISSVMSGTFSPPSNSYALYGIYSDVSSVSSTYSTVYSGSFMGGNVGIGTITPSYTLHVSGTVSSTGYNVGATAGFTGTGTYTSFTIVGGIIVSAS